MGTAERRLEILKYLCQNRHATTRELSEEFGVCVRTIGRDIFEIETTLHAPIIAKSGRYGGGIYIVGDYTFDRAYMKDSELALLTKVQELTKDQLSQKEQDLFAKIIKNYTKKI